MQLTPNALSAKISQLVKEGYPQKQAIAVAYSEMRNAWRDKHPAGRFPSWLEFESRGKNPVKKIKQWIIRGTSTVSGKPFSMVVNADNRKGALSRASEIGKNIDITDCVLKTANNPISEKTANFQGEISVSKSNLRKIKIDENNYRIFNALINANGKLFTLDYRPYIEALNEQGIFYTIKKEVKNNPISEKTAHKLRKASPRTFEKMTDEEIKRGVKVKKARKKSVRKNPVRPLKKKPYIKTKTRFFFVDEKINNVWKPVATFQNKFAAFDYAKAYGKQSNNRIRVTDTRE